MEKKIWRETLDVKAKPLAGMLEHVAGFKRECGARSRISGKVNVCHSYRVHRQTTDGFKRRIMKKGVKELADAQRKDSG